MTKELYSQQLRECFRSDFVSAEHFIQVVLEPLFHEITPLVENDMLTETDYAQYKTRGLQSVHKVAQISDGFNPIEVYDIVLQETTNIAVARVYIQQFVRSMAIPYSSAFLLFHYADPANREWRFSYLYKEDTNASITNAKRFTYLFGKDHTCRTAEERFAELFGQDNIEKQQLLDAFSVEALSKEFFTQYDAIYQRFCKYIEENQTLFGEEFRQDTTGKTTRDYVKKLLGRITFLCFLQKKRWLNNNIHFMRDLFYKATPEQQANFLDEVLEPLFFDCLNRQRPNDIFNTGVTALGETHIPYLNGGLFERDKIDTARSQFPADYFRELFDFYEQYNFTIDENDPNDAEVGVDPEMLGKIFESQLEDNKDKGAFYTPKEIVQYMCRESLISYLTNCAMENTQHKFPREQTEASVRQLVQTPEQIAPKMNARQKEDFGKALREVKICDPAIGSGAFPMGLLNELVRLRVSIDAWADKPNDIAALKREIIQNNIYGVDIEQGAIDIARLRFWLSIVVDETTPSPLPNFDYKFMQGNSLLEQFEGMDLSNLLPDNSQQDGVIAFSEDTIQQVLLKENLDRYFAETNHDLKHSMRANIDSIVKRLIQVRTAGRNDIYSHIAPIDIAANDKFFLWHTWFADVFNRPNKQGFDIVIGNPPYLFLSGKGSPVQRLKREEKYDEATALQKLLNLYKEKYPEASSGCCDFYKWFYALALRIVKKNGTVSYITPDTYFNMPKYKDIRTLLLGNSIIKMVDLGFHVFDAPCVSSSIILLTKDDVVSTSVPFVDIKNILTKNNRAHLLDFINDGLQGIPVNSYDLSLYKHPIAERIYLNEDGLYSVASDYLRFIEGEHDIQKENVRTTPNSGFVPLLLDGTMSKYSFVDKVYTQSNTLITDIHKGERCLLRKTGDTIVVSIPHDFSPAIAHQNVYVVKSTTDIPIKFWFGFLNSKMLTFLYQNGLYGQKGRTMAQFRKYALDILPIPPISVIIQKEIIDYVEKLLSAKRANPQADTSEFERQINNKVYELYDLTEDEIKLVEGA